MKKDKFIVIILIIMIMLLIVNLIFSFSELADYNKRKTSGNARWNQVEEVYTIPALEVEEIADGKQ